jgi:hypothetical protein
MNILPHAAVISAFLLALSGSARGAGPESGAAGSFPVAKVHFEQNATDGDVEVVFEVKADKDGLAELMIRSPDGRPVVTFKAPDASTLGMRQFRFESPESSDVKSLKAAYPEGAYEFSGTTFAGAKLSGKSTLSHRLPATTAFAKPAPGAEEVAVKNFRMSWKAVEGVASYIVNIEQLELNVNISALLPGSSTSFALPDGFLARDKEYTMAIGTVTREGNVSFVESSFTTAK